MTDNYLVDAIGELMDQKLEPINKDLKSIKEDVSALKQEVSSLNKRSTRIEVILENDVTRDLNLLAEGHMENTTQLKQLIVGVAEIQEKVGVLYITTEKNVREINKLKYVE